MEKETCCRVSFRLVSGLFSLGSSSGTGYLKIKSEKFCPFLFFCFLICYISSKVLQEDPCHHLRTPEASKQIQGMFGNAKGRKNKGESDFLNGEDPVKTVRNPDESERCSENHVQTQ
jgi:hypothetical protein